jgi:hypothetical protein
MKKVKVEFNSIGNGLLKAILTNLEELYSERANAENENKFVLTLNETGAVFSTVFKQEELGAKNVGTPIAVRINLTNLNSEQDILVHISLDMLVIKDAVITTESETLFKGHAGDTSDIDTILNIVGVIDILDEFAKGNDAYDAYAELLRPELLEEKRSSVKEVLTDYKNKLIDSIGDNLTYTLLSLSDLTNSAGIEELVETEEYGKLYSAIVDNCTSKLAGESIEYIKSISDAIEDFSVTINTEKLLALDEEEDDAEYDDEHECDCGHHHEADEDYDNEDDSREASYEDIEAVETMVDAILDLDDDVAIDDVISFLGKVSSHRSLEIDTPPQLSELVNLLEAKKEEGVDPYDLAFNFIEYYHENLEEEDDDIVYDSEE